jgi:hypothetical protein
LGLGLGSTHLRTRGRPEGGGSRAGADVRTEARQALFDVWCSRLDTRTGTPELRVVEAILPHWGDWLDGGGPPLTYRVTQMLTGQGCFDEYQYRIRREVIARCHHCDGVVPIGGSRDRNGPLAAGDNESLAGFREDSERDNLLLRASDAAEGGSGEGTDTKLPPRKDRGA